MGVSKHRKNHKQKVQSRNNKINDEKKRIQKLAKSFYRQEQAAIVASVASDAAKKEKESLEIESDLTRRQNVYMSAMTNEILSSSK